ncbi:MAG: hypothetical protein ACXWBP_02860 [Limisphaerales bacterium]
MKRMFFLLLCLGFAHCANAAILFYKQVLSVTVTGGGRAMARNFSGFTLIDSATGDVIFVSADVRSKRFKVEQPDHKISTVQFSSSGYKTVLQIQSGAGEGLNARGVNTWLNVGGSQPISSPSTFIVGGCDAYVPPGLPGAYSFDYRGAIIYDKTDTIDSTNNGLTLAGASDKARQLLIARGFSED